MLLFIDIFSDSLAPRCVLIEEKKVEASFTVCEFVCMLCVHSGAWFEARDGGETSAWNVNETRWMDKKIVAAKRKTFSRGVHRNEHKKFFILNFLLKDERAAQRKKLNLEEEFKLLFSWHEWSFNHFF